MRSTGQDFSQAQQTYAAMKFSPAKQPDPQLQQRAVDEAERNARELMETEEKEKRNLPQSSDLDKRKMRRKMVKLAQIQRALEETERNDAEELIEANERKGLNAPSKKDNNSRKMVEKKTETQTKPETVKVVETADCVICLEIIRDDDVYCINASCRHILYCSTCARQAH
jgi:hypothetical protein